MNNRINFIKNDLISFEKNALTQLYSFLEIEETIYSIKCSDLTFFENLNPDILNVSVTPDFHKGTIIPIGTVIQTKDFIIPQAIGSDINCGMRLYTTNLKYEDLYDKLDLIEQKIREIFFEGKREIPMNKVQREAMLREGLYGLLETSSHSKNIGCWKYFDNIKQEKEINRVSDKGSFVAKEILGLDDFLGTNELSYDSQIGTIGGGNHFVELQKVSKIFDQTTARAFGLSDDQIVVMIHTGSLMIGQSSGFEILNILKNIYPNKMKKPLNGVYPLPNSDSHKKSFDNFWTLMYNATNFGFANRLFLGLMTQRSLTEVLGEVDFNLLYDAPHNLVWREDDNGFLHRKGACPARGMEEMQDTDFFFYGEPVLIPGSMGSSSYIMKGTGNNYSLYSASHGAGRKLSRGKALKEEHSKFLDFIENFRIITPIDPKRNDVAGRSDILKKWEDNIKSEAPYAYKNINEIIDSQVTNNIVDRVAEVKPILTIKN